MDRIRLIASDMDATLLDEYSQLPPKFTETQTCRPQTAS